MLTIIALDASSAVSSEIAAASSLETRIRPGHIHHMHRSLLGRRVDHVELAAGIHAMPQARPYCIRESFPDHLGSLFVGMPVREVTAEILSKFATSPALVVHHLEHACLWGVSTAM